MEQIDVAIIGAGVVGMSSAFHLSQEGASVMVIEKELEPAAHQSTRNSGVMHAGYNPKPGSAKAKYCVEGNRQLREYCYENGIPVREGGILIIAQDDNDSETVLELYRRGKENGANVELIKEDQIPEIEPNAHGICALQALDGASFEPKAFVQSLANDSIRNGARLQYNAKVESIEESDNGVVLNTDKFHLRAGVVINAAGLHADHLAGELSDDMRVIPFRGYYAELVPEKTNLINSHVYATPDLNFPFLGVHLSKKTDGRVIVGPGAMLALGREGYGLTSISGGGLFSTFGWPGFYRMMAKPEFRKLIRQEIHKSLSIKEIGREAMKLISGIENSDLVRSYAGNRAQLVDRQGNLVEDIVVRETPRTVHVLNAVSPGLTCSLPFGKHLAQKATNKL